MRVEDVQRPPGRVLDAHVRTDPRLLPVLPAQHVMVGDELRRLGVVAVDAERGAVDDDGEPHRGERGVAEPVGVGAEVEGLVREGPAALVEGPLQLGHERFELGLLGMRAAEGKGGPQRKRLDFLHAEDVRKRLHRRDAAGDAALAAAGRRDTPQGVSEVPDVVAE